MLPNTNERTGVRYGVVSGNGVPDFFDEILSCGTDLAHEQAVRDLSSTLSSSLAESVTQAAESAEQSLAESLRDAVVHAIGDLAFRPEEVADAVVDDEFVRKVADGGVDDEIVASLVDRLGNCGLWDHFGDGGDCSYEYEMATPEGAVRVVTGSLGGSTLVYVVDSPWRAACRPCSPCVPRAGDLDSPDEGGVEAYCLPPDAMPEGWAGVARLVPNP